MDQSTPSGFGLAFRASEVGVRIPATSENAGTTATIAMAGQVRSRPSWMPRTAVPANIVAMMHRLSMAPMRLSRTSSPSASAATSATPVRRTARRRLTIAASPAASSSAAARIVPPGHREASRLDGSATPRIAAPTPNPSATRALERCTPATNIAVTSR